jgi:hypothetical protein
MILAQKLSILQLFAYVLVTFHVVTMSEIYAVVTGIATCFVILSAAKESVCHFKTEHSDSFAALRMTKQIACKSTS